MPPLSMPPLTEERENVYKAMLGMKLSFDERLGDLNNELVRVEGTLGAKFDRLDEKYDQLATDVRDILKAELEKARGQGALRGTVSGGAVSALILALLPLLERLF